MVVKELQKGFAEHAKAIEQGVEQGHPWLAAKLIKKSKIKGRF